MTLDKGSIGRVYLVEETDLPAQLEKRMEALGMTKGTRIQLIHKKPRGTMVLMLRGTRFAVGQGVTSKIKVREA
ncbi:ferrous iron transport protein A [Anaerovorax odorimutans]|uniref:Ferrous iron transport protein A n=1 Tax=Anaerovorax odorimutans TaxID=109327 RepID=A0ABT1RSK9_9FIRM|nr:FeoA family protein [Anaerovorax odorimutans]MCQ4638193.1 ferrous iron transport protein A [Anaerovorax odorimutans]